MKKLSNEALEACRAFFPNGTSSEKLFHPDDGSLEPHEDALDELVRAGWCRRRVLSDGAVSYTGVYRAGQVARKVLRSAHPLTQGLLADGPVAAKAREMYDSRRLEIPAMPAWEDIDENDDYHLGLRDACLFFARDSQEREQSNA